jgi:hypothetical protein
VSFAEISSKKEQLQGNRSTPRVADASCGEATKFVRKIRTTETDQNASDEEQEDALEAQTEKKKPRRRAPEAQDVATTTAPSSAAESGDLASSPRPKQNSS